MCDVTLLADTDLKPVSVDIATNVFFLACLLSSCHGYFISRLSIAKMAGDETDRFVNIDKLLFLEIFSVL